MPNGVLGWFPGLCPQVGHEKNHCYGQEVQGQKTEAPRTSICKHELARFQRRRPFCPSGGAGDGSAGSDGCAGAAPGGCGGAGEGVAGSGSAGTGDRCAGAAPGGCGGAGEGGAGSARAGGEGSADGGCCDCQRVNN